MGAKHPKYYQNPLYHLILEPDRRQALAQARRWRPGFRGYFARVSEIAPLHETLGFETVALTGLKPAIGPDDETYNRLEGTQHVLWLDLLEEINAEPSSLASSRHLLYISRKASGFLS